MRTERIGSATLYLGDCREVLPTLVRVGAIITDPPFNVPVKYQDSGKVYPRSWGDLIVMEPFFADVFCMLRRVVGDNQVYICCDAHSYPVFYKIAYPLWPQSGMIVWYKPSGRRGRGWMHSHELILHLRTPITDYAEGFRQDVIGVMPVRTLDREHPAEKPGDLLDFVADALPHDRLPVLDPFMGSGTMGVSCLRGRRPFIGIESDERWFDIACKRLQDADRQGSLFIDAPVPEPPEDERMSDLFTDMAAD